MRNPRKGQRRSAPVQPPHQTASIQEWHHYSKRKLTCEGCIQRGKTIAELESILRHYKTLIKFKNNAAVLKVGPAR